MAMRLDQRHSVGSFNPGTVALSDLGMEEMEDLLGEMIEMAQSGLLVKSEKRKRGNLYDSYTFTEAASKRANSRSENPEYAVNRNMQVESGRLEVRERIVSRLGDLKREGDDKPVPFESLFGVRFLNDFDWVTQTREKIVEIAVDHQRDFVEQPFNPLLLCDLKQDDIARKIGHHVTSVSRLIRNLHIKFPDSLTRDFAVLVPGNSLPGLKARFALATLAMENQYYDRDRGVWLVSDEQLTDLLKEKFDMQLARRTVTKHVNWVDSALLKKRRSADTISSVSNEESDCETDDIDGVTGQD